MSVIADIFRTRTGSLAWVIGCLGREPRAARRAERHPRQLTVVAADRDLSSSETVRAMYSSVKKAIADEHAESVLVDLSDVDIADTKVVACLVVLRRTATRAGKRLDVRLSPAVAAWTGVCRLNKLVDEVAGEDRACPGRSDTSVRAVRAVAPGPAGAHAA